MYPVRGQSHGQFRNQRMRRARRELSDPANVGHPALIPISLLMPGNKENNENPDQRPYQKELAHKTALCLCGIRTLPVGTSGYKQNRGGEREAGEYLGTCRALVNRPPGFSFFTRNQVDHGGDFAHFGDRRGVNAPCQNVSTSANQPDVPNCCARAR